jgi:integrase/recombinase XerD
MGKALALLTTDEPMPADTLTADLVRLRTGHPQSRHLGAVVAVYCRWLQNDPDRRDATRRAYSSDVMSFADAIGEQGLALIGDVDTAAVELWKHGMAGLEPSTICRKLTAASGFFAWAALWDLCKTNPVDRVRRPRKKHIEAVYLTLTDFSKLMSACRTSQERAVLGCLFWGGLRAHEPGNLRVADVDLCRGYAD